MLLFYTLWLGFKSIRKQVALRGETNCCNPQGPYAHVRRVLPIPHLQVGIKQRWAMAEMWQRVEGPISVCPGGQKAAKCVTGRSLPDLILQDIWKRLLKTNTIFHKVGADPPSPHHHLFHKIRLFQMRRCRDYLIKLLPTIGKTSTTPCQTVSAGEPCLLTVRSEVTVVRAVWLKLPERFSDPRRVVTCGSREASAIAVWFLKW